MKILNKKTILSSAIMAVALSSSIVLTGCSSPSNGQARAIAGSVIGGVIGHQFGRGSGKKAATVAGAIVGGVIGSNAGRRPTYR